AILPRASDADAGLRDGVASGAHPPVFDQSHARGAGSCYRRRTGVSRDVSIVGSPAADRASSSRGWTGFAVKAGMSIAILSVLIARTDVRHLATLVASVSGAAAVVVLVLIVSQTLVTAYRWVLVMAGVGASIDVWPAIQALFASLFINQCLPSYVGGDA